MSIGGRNLLLNLREAIVLNPEFFQFRSQQQIPGTFDTVSRAAVRL